MSDQSDRPSTPAPVIPDLGKLPLRAVLRNKLAQASTSAPAPASAPAVPSGSAAPVTPSSLGPTVVDISASVPSAVVQPSPTVPLTAVAPSLPPAPAPEATLPFSVLRFDARHPEVRGMAERNGWSLEHRQVALIEADLTFTTDGWTTTRTAPLARLMDGGWGFRLEDVVPGTELEFAIHAQLGLSASGDAPYEARLDVWFNNGGANYRAPAEAA